MKYPYPVFRIRIVPASLGWSGCCPCPHDGFWQDLWRCSSSLSARTAWLRTALWISATACVAQIMVGHHCAAAGFLNGKYRDEIISVRRLKKVFVFLRKRRPLCWLDILEGRVCELRLWLTYAKSTHSLHTPRMLIAALYFGNFTVGGSFQKERSHNRIFNLRAMGSASLRRAFWSLCHSAVLRWLDVSHCVSGKTKGNFLKFCVVRAF